RASSPTHSPYTTLFRSLRVSTVGEATTPGRVDGSLTGAGAPSVPASSGEGDESAGKGASDVPAAEEEGNVVQPPADFATPVSPRSEEHTSELQSRFDLV